MTKNRGDEAEEFRRVKFDSIKQQAGGLFEIQFPAPSVPSPSSEAAADALTFTKRGKNSRAKQLLTVLALIASRPSGYTIDEIDEATGMGSGSACARIDDLRTMQYITTSAKCFRKTRRGRNAAVQFATAEGYVRLKEAA